MHFPGTIQHDQLLFMDDTGFEIWKKERKISGTSSKKSIDQSFFLKPT